MKKSIVLILTGLFLSGVSCVNAGKTDDVGTLIKIKTEFGEITLKLFDDTPEHRNNFIKLVNEGFYTDLLFHRVIKNFMVQGGDPDSKNAQPGQQLGGGSPDYTIPAEILPQKYFHKKGALAAARRGGPSNPEKRSSASQFYIVQGGVFTHGKLDTMEISITNRMKTELLQKHLEKSTDELNIFKTNNDRAGFDIRISEIRAKVDSIFAASNQKFTFTEEQRKAYTTIGGYPSLDGDYTVFGEVISGIEVIDKIAAVETDPNNRPLNDIKMQIELAE